MEMDSVERNPILSAWLKANAKVTSYRHSHRSSLKTLFSTLFSPFSSFSPFLFFLFFFIFLSPFFFFRLGHKGKVDLKYIQEASGGFYYRDHLPILGKKSTLMYIWLMGAGQPIIDEHQFSFVFGGPLLLPIYETSKNSFKG